MVTATRSRRVQSSEETSRSLDGGLRDKTESGDNTGDDKSVAMPSTTATPSSNFRKSSRETPVKIMSTSGPPAQAFGSHETHSLSTLPQDRNLELETNGRSDSPVRRSQRIQKSVASSSPGLKNSNKSSSSLVNKKVNELKNSSSPSAEGTESKDKSKKLAISNNPLSKKGKLFNARTYRALFMPHQPHEKINNSDVTMVSTRAMKIDHLDPSAVAVPNNTDASLTIGLLTENCPPSPSSPEVRNVDSCKDDDEFPRQSRFLSSLDTANETIPLKEDMVRPEESDCNGISQEHLSPTFINHLVVGSKDDGSYACVMCGRLNAELSCEGKDCRRSYHLCCVEPSLQSIPPGAWLCISCVKKRIEHGVYSVTEGIDSVWDFREGIQNGNLYFVKYKGLAHVHNSWIPESQLLTEAPKILEIFNGRCQKEKVNVWNKVWIEPDRLLLRRTLLPPKVADIFFEKLSDKSLKCYHEWFVKWRGLGYEDATWEMENLPCLGTPNAMKLMTDYETRISKTLDSSGAEKIFKLRQDAFRKLSWFPEDFPTELDNDHLNSVNKLWEFWHKPRHALFIDKQDRATKSILFIMSLLRHTCRPFLIIATRDSLSLWESKFRDLAPFINLVVYSGIKDIRNMIQTLEFYNDSGCIMFQVLLSHPDVVLEDLETLKCIFWEAILVDDCETFRISEHFKQLNCLSTDFRVLLLGAPLKDSIDEYANVLSFLGCDVPENIFATVHCNSKDSILALPSFKEKLASYLAYEHKLNYSRFLEYWVPVDLTPVQLESYCAMLLSKSTIFCSSSKSDSADVLRDVLVSARMCCDHPYLVDESLYSTLSKNVAVSDYLTIGVNANGKLQLLDKILREFRTKGLRVVILFQSIAPGKVNIGDILDDFLAQRFGADTYERVGNGLTRLKKVAAMNNFNDKKEGRFVFLIEHRACLPSIKLSSVDAVIIYSSDWNPLNDLRVLQKINIETQQVHIPVFRLYSSLTVEEKVLVLAKQDVILDCNIANVTWTNLHSLLSWGAFDLFRHLDDFHQHDHSSGGLLSSTDKILDNTVMEIMSVLSSDDSGSNPSKFSSLIKVCQSGASYSRHIILAGEAKGVSSLDKDPPSFWSSLLNQRSPQWKYVSDPSQRSRRKIPSSDEILKSPEPEHEENGKKRRKLGSVDDSANLQNWKHDEKRETAGNPKENDLSGSGMSPVSNLHGFQRKERLSLSQESMHILLKPELTLLCEKLRLPVDVEAKAQEFLEYIIRNHSVGRGSEATLQALKIALCWRAASLMMHDIDRGETVARAKKYLNYTCDEEHAAEIYRKLKILKKIFWPAKNSAKAETELKSAEKQSHLPVECDYTTNSSLHQRVSSGFKTVSTENLKLTQQESTPASDVPVKVGSLKDELINKQIELVNKACERRMMNLLAKQDKERADLIKYKEKEELRLKETHNKDLAICHTLHTDSSEAIDGISLLNHDFSEKMDRLDRHFESQLLKLADLHIIAREKENLMKEHWLKAAAKCDPLPVSFDDISLPDSGFRFDEFSCVAEHGDDNDNVMQTKDSLPCKQSSAYKQTVSAYQQTVSLEATKSNTIISDISGSISSEAADGMQTRTSVPCCIHMDDKEAFAQSQTNVDVPSTRPPERTSGMLKGAAVANSDMPDNIHTQPQNSVCNHQLRNEQGLSCQNKTRHFNPKLGIAMDTESIASEPVLNKTLLHANTVAPIPDETRQDICADNHQLSGTRDIAEDGSKTDLISPPTSNQAESIHVQALRAGELEMSCECGELGDGNSTIPQGTLPSVSVDTVLHTDVLMQDLVVPSPTGLANNTFSASNCPQQSMIMPLVGQNSERLQGNLEIPVAPSSRSQQIDVTMQEAVLVSAPAVQPVQHNVNVAPQRSDDENARTTSGRAESFHSLQPFPLTPLPPHQVLQPEPLRNELIKIKNHENVLTKMHDETKLRLNSECKEEIEKIKRKYENLLQGAENEFLQSKKILETIYNKVLMNQILAEEFRAKFTEVKVGTSSQGKHSSLSQPVRQLQPDSSRSVSGPPSLPTIFAATGPQGIRSFPPISRFRPPNSAAAPATQAPSSFVRPQFSSVAPRAGGPVGNEPRAPAPHLHRFRPINPSTTLNMDSRTWARAVAFQKPISSDVNVAATIGQAAPLLSTQRIPVSGVCQQAVSSTNPVSTVELPSDVRNYQERRNLPNLPQLDETRPLTDGQSNFARAAGPALLRTAVSNHSSAADILCLSDDE